MNTTPRTTRFLRVAAVVALVGIGLTACGDDASETSSTDGPAAQVGANEVSVDGAWARTSPAGVTTGAAYATLAAADDDALLRVEVDASIAAEAQIHEVVMADAATSDSSMSTDMSMSSDTMAAGEMTMQPVDKIELPAGETVTLEPGGYHIMLMDLVKPLTAGETFSLELIFEKAGTKTVQFIVSDDAP